ncbi:MAG: c-type cytochrome [Alphaproteobacteria bacterium]|nr:c-type cytochrome [Alphaproteobacteria bacterium]
MSIKAQMIAGAILVALILTVVSNMVGDLLVPRPKPVAVVEAPAEQAAPGQAAPQQAAPQQAGQAEPEPPMAALLAAAKPEEGKAVAKKCASCHTFDPGAPNRVGPNLADMVGADIAAKPGYAYSEALTAKPGNWSYENLDAFLTKPAGFAPGTKMTFAGVPAAADRAALIAYLRSLTANPPPLPR